MCNTNICAKLTPMPFYDVFMPLYFKPPPIYSLTVSVWVIHLSIFPYENIILSYTFMFTPTVSEAQLERKTRS